MRMATLAIMLGFSACGQPDQQPTPSQAQGVDTVYSIMTKRVDPFADNIWGIGNDALNDEAGIDPAKMSPEAWGEMATTAAKMEDAAKALAALDPIRVAAKGQEIVDEGNPLAPTAARVQSQIDAAPAAFRAMARTLEHNARDLAVAARARDAQAAGRLVNEMDGVCEGCHLQFWYPEDRKVLEAIAKR